MPWEEPVPTETSVSAIELPTTVAHTRQQLPELLAPAGSWEALRAAIGAGADAVYLGGKKFGARQLADNFDMTQIGEAIELAHRKDVRVYVTVNTLIAEQEREEAAKFLLFLYEAGADAVLLQDAGLAFLARKIVPGLALHASTQMTIHNREGVLWAAEQGFQRVVLAREISFAEIQEIVRHTMHHPIGLEIFIHGALCYGYSGQCLLSSSIGGRSGNRGWCAQPCRKPYTLVSYHPDEYDRPVSITSRQEERYYLSMQDLCTYSILDQIVRVPIAALKIEGRMKSPEYVATVVRVYRNALDRIREGTWKPQPSDMRDLLLAFNRGFTTGHLGGAYRRIIVGSERQDNRGFPIGKVLSCETESGQLRIRLSGDQLPAPGDGLHFFLRGRDGTDCGWEMTSPPEVRGNTLMIPCREPVPPGAQVSITRSVALEHELRRTRKATTPVPSRRIPLDLEVVWEDGTPRFHGTVHLHDGRIIPVSYESPVVMEPAVKHPLTADEIARQLCRTGGTPFTISTCQLRYPGGLFTVPSQINRVRREFLSAVETALVSARLPSRTASAEAHWHFNDEFTFEKSDERLHPPPSSTSLTLTTYVSDLSGLRAAAEGGSDRVCLEMGPESMEEILIRIDDLSLCSSPSLVWKWPRITTDATIAAALPILPHLTARGINEIMVDSPGAARALQVHAPLFSRAGSSGLNIWNHHTVAAYAPLFSSLTLSPELSLAQIQALLVTGGASRPLFEVMVQGNQEVMISENCSFQGRNGCGRSPCTPAVTGTRWGLIDQRDRFFPLEVDHACRIHLFNAVETCAIDHLTELREIGIDRIVIDARFRSPRYTREMVSLYRKALGHLQDRTRIVRKDMSDLKEEIKRRTRGGITHGPFRTGLREPLDGETR